MSAGTIVLLAYLAGAMLSLVPTARFLMTAAGISNPDHADCVMAAIWAVGFVLGWPLYLPILWIVAVLKNDKLKTKRYWMERFQLRGKPSAAIKAATEQPPARFAELVETAERQREMFIEPRDETDPFCTCPKCQLLGTHEIRWEVFRRRRLPVSDGDYIDVSGFGDPRDGTKETIRTCRFCGHTWRTSYPLTERESA